MKIAVAAIQMPSEPLAVAANLERAEAWLAKAHAGGAELAVLPELFNTGYGRCADYWPYGEDRSGPTLRRLQELSRRWRMGIAAGYVERDGRHLYNSVAFLQPEGAVDVYRKRNIVFWERFRFRAGRGPLVVATPWGRIGFAICADMIYAEVWNGYRGRIDLAVVSSAWPDFADRETGRKHWLLGQVGPLSRAIPGRVARDLDIPVVFANQCGPTETIIPGLGRRIADRFAGGSSVCDGRHAPPVHAGADEQMVLAQVTVQPPKGLHSWRTMSPSVRVAS